MAFYDEIYPPGAEDIYPPGWEEDAGAGADDDVAALLSVAAGDVWVAGAARKRMNPAVRQRLVQRAALVRRREPNRYREYPLGFDSGSTLVAAAGTQTVTSRPQVAFKGKRLAVSRSSAPSFAITNLTVGKNSQFVTTDAIPAEAFADNAFGMNLELDTCQPAMNISIAIENISNASARFRATLIGHAIE